MTSPRRPLPGRPAPLHPRNRHQGSYDFPALMRVSPALKPFVAPTPRGNLSIDFTDPQAVRALNRALLALHHGVRDWDIPADFLCPPIPGRADYLHHLADLLAEGNGGQLPRGERVRLLDVGTGANGVYPLIGFKEYGWHFVGSDIAPAALEAFSRTLAANPDCAAAIELRRQPDPQAIFAGILQPGEHYAATLCNPPFHASPTDAVRGSQRKWKNLGKTTGKQVPLLNFGGQAAELWCPGGEAAFIERMIRESRRFAPQVGWFTCLVSKASNLPMLQAALRREQASEIRVVAMAQGQKQSRFLAWRFA
ncbi:23S rRNA methyltransferase [Pseudomonas oryzihabitans]|uniref:23S rRNA (adenine(1618)-N(6))-methyltransferase RlmF n=1 Tax=Pseudomonas rhizoryzae TaxID=2571129 RepID=UPI000736B211|nr:23S rRNA (adenine(1618)-N(6))-methyltransferase RlmF [Pseudomonas rhizoryzae]KTS78545.1 23S rRNA methyltransferase [Pseudomonas psychrotolerans]KTT03650.1 23S rRNA methyltransferase [Pseudomonas psychrotolerans]KTT22439.1 23S rRNA methyltransferase [Pseudomonas psychrotolerans]KTT63128.1 23S rRNA methyltransferase [Pseudomonas psychrotolerans]